MLTFTRDSLRASVESASGGRRTVIYNDKGHPCYMVRIPKFRCEDVAPGGELGSGIFPAFTAGGVERSELLLGQYQARVYDGRAVSIGGVDPTTNIDYDQAKGYCEANGPGWHLMSVWEWAAVAFWSMANGFEPRGNTDWGRAHDANHEVGIRGDDYLPGVSDGSGRTNTGSGPAAWRHDDTMDGLADLVGNVWEWQDQFKLVDGEIFATDDNDHTVDEANWPSLSRYFDTSSGVALTDSAPAGTGSNGVDPWNNVDTANYTALEKLARLLVAPVGIHPQGKLYVDDTSERLPVRGGYRGNAGGAGLGALNLGYARGDSNSNIGCRPALAI